MHTPTPYIPRLSLFLYQKIFITYQVYIYIYIYLVFLEGFASVFSSVSQFIKYLIWVLKILVLKNFLSYKQIILFCNVFLPFSKLLCTKINFHQLRRRQLAINQCFHLCIIVLVTESNPISNAERQQQRALS